MRRIWTFLLVMVLSMSIALGFNLVVNHGISAQEQIVPTYQPPQPLPVSELHLTYPPAEHKTSSDQIFLIGSAPIGGEVLVNGKPIDRSEAGHFAPSFPLVVGKNIFKLSHGDRTIDLVVTRLNQQTSPPTELGFDPKSLAPQQNIARLPGERICFEAIATPNAEVQLALGSQTLPLKPATRNVELPANSAVLTNLNQPQVSSATGIYRGCTAFKQIGQLGQPEFTVIKDKNTVKQKATGAIEILDLDHLAVAEVTAKAGVARTGPGTNYSRLTPLPQGTKAAINGLEGDWLRLDYGGWIKKSETTVTNQELPHSIIRGFQRKIVAGWTELIFPLQAPVPVTVLQSDRQLKLTLHNVTAQTDTALLGQDPVIKRLDWQQISSDSDRVKYKIQLKPKQQWGYKLEYRGTSLVLSLKHPPAVDTNNSAQPLQGVKILLDQGHGSNEDLGARGPTGYPEKDVTLVLGKLVRDELVKQGATVYLTRNGDEDLFPADRVAMIEQLEPAIAVSLHYNALPDNGDAINTMGIGSFWYHPQSHDLATFLHDYLVLELDRPTYGIFWNNLALARPTVAPSVLMEFGFMINPEEFEWIIDPQAQQELAKTTADGIAAWLMSAVAED
ncbi:cell wall hydrolase/autolysin [Thalassoporum mexicanum PCC 7367]|uniref:N-acetylmuramoyl-L-alanine amidase n=1 Tax=Thalassoporum mexicanum TaxID=3457544 RepID=UPI00029FCE7D|nr:N-acetylmuramoyl-L-alanine amidase [Pseudanabaena sp. PCC 7367]AFY70312.1 cell wall hydrolase/autolysin [Pseudanabaena sp. PCC 7367]